MIKAPLWTCLRVTARPGGCIDSKDEWPVVWPVLDEQTTQTALVDPSLCERLVETAVASFELGLKTESRDGGDRARCAQQCITELEEGVCPRGERPINQRAELGQIARAGADDVWCLHISQYNYCLIRKLGY